MQEKNLKNYLVATSTIQISWKQSNPKVGELNLPFSSYACPKSDFYFYLQPKVDDDWKKKLFN